MSDYKTTDYCAQCGCSPDAAQHFVGPNAHVYVPPAYPMRTRGTSERVEYNPSLVIPDDVVEGLRELGRRVVDECGGMFTWPRDENLVEALKWIERLR